MEDGGGGSEARDAVEEAVVRLSAGEIAEIDAEVAIVPSRAAATIEALKVVQRHRGWVSDGSLRAVAAHLGVPEAELEGVASFYNLIFRRPVGRHVILWCDSVSCWVMGCDPLATALRAKLGVGPGETTADGRFTLLPIACLGICDHAPALMIDDDLHVDLTPEGLDDVLARYA